jgi:primosomal protein N' (replication factor Y)
VNYYAQVILPLSLAQRYTYVIPVEWQDSCKVGVRVEVNFGKKKLYTGIVALINTIPPKGYIAKPILGVIDEMPIVTERQLALWKWIAQYYMCSEGEVMDAAMPAYFKLQSSAAYIRNISLSYNSEAISEEEYLVLHAFEYQSLLTRGDIEDILQNKKVAKTIKSLLERQLIIHEEMLDERYKPRMQTFIQWSEDFVQDKARAFELIEKSPKQEQLLLAFITLTKNQESIAKVELLKKAEVSASVLKTILQKNILVAVELPINRIDTQKITLDNNIQLSAAQHSTFKSLKNSHLQNNIALLHGVTASGKTHIYAKLIQDIVTNGGQVLFLVPEITLTTQLVKRLSQLFGHLSVYHSKFNPAQRIEIWKHVLSGDASLVVGARSALFLPFKNLQLIIMDEEHDSSYKQTESNPRYHARSVAQYIAKLFDAKLLLGSATPSIESFFLAQKGNIGLATLTERYQSEQRPRIVIIPLTKDSDLPEHGISPNLSAMIHHTLEDKKQAVIFYHRRAYAPYVICAECSWIPQCKYCDIALSYHKYKQELACHICGYKQTIPKSCPSCHSTYIVQKGIGTERIEDDAALQFEGYRIARMDQDSTRTKNLQEQLISDLEAGDIDVLIGTQMVTKGLDTDNITLVAVLQADVLFYFPDFRARERAMQLLVQIMGRAGRRNQQGTMAIQTYNPHSPYYAMLENYDHKKFFDIEIIERNTFRYPPFVKLISVIIKHKDRDIANNAAQSLALSLKKLYAESILGPVEPHISRVKNWYLQEILVKIEPNTFVLSQVKHEIKFIALQLTQYEKFRQVVIQYDVDP